MLNRIKGWNIPNRVRALHQRLKAWLVKTYKQIRYRYKLSFWACKKFLRLGLVILGRYMGLVRRVLVVLVALGVGVLVNYFGGEHFTADILSNFLISAGAMIGGVIAIVFTMSIFLLQSAADLYSSQFFEVYVHDWKEKIVYFLVIVITLVFFGGGLYIGSLGDISSGISSKFVLLSLLLIGSTFALIDWQYKTVRQKTNPAEAIAFLEREATQFLKKLHLDAQAMAGIINARDESMTLEAALATTYNYLLQPFIKNLDKQLENLVAISLKLADRQEVDTARRGFTAVHNILINFLDVRKTSSLAIPSATVFLAIESDSQSFLAKSFERLNKAGEKFIQEKKDESATYILDIYNSLATKAKDISFIGHTNENPILDHIIGYLNFLVEIGERAGNVEVVYRGASVLGKIAIIAVNSGLQSTLFGLQEKILKIANFGILQKQLVITDECVTSFLNITTATFGNERIIRKHAFDDSIKNIGKISASISQLISTHYLPDDFSRRISMSKGYDEFPNRLAAIFNHYPKVQGEREKARYRKDIVSLFEEIGMSLRKLSEDIKTCDSTLNDSVGRLIFYINNLIIELLSVDDFKGEKAELLRRLHWNIHLPSWFAHNAESFDGGSNAFNTLTDSVAKTGILAAVELKDKKLVEDSISSIWSITKHALEKTKDGYGYDEPRVLEKACYLGIIALKNGWNDVVEMLGMLIYEFEYKFFEKYLTNLPTGIDPHNHRVIGLPQDNQLFVELLRWRNDFETERFNRTLGIRDDAEAMMYSVVDEIDIDRFMYEIWGSFPADSKIEEEIELKRKTSAVKRFVAVLTKRPK
ncbi:MAG: hypothetical protein JWN50_657 [Parcubacteria group bacterium]|nr:hypothetical protein [Parcubacteria group bacterium]